MRQIAVAALLLSWAMLNVAAAAPAPADIWSAPEPVRIEGYSGEAMEPFLSRDGQVLFFNTRNDPGVDTDIHFARRRDDVTFVHQGVLAGTQSPVLDGVPTMSRDGHFCFISPRDYRQTLNSVFCGHFDGSRVTEVMAQTGLRTARLGHLIFDVEVSADGAQMIFAEGVFSGGAVPDAADLYLAERSANGYVRSNDSARILQNVNSGDLEYAPALSADGPNSFSPASAVSGYSGRRKFIVQCGRAWRPRSAMCSAFPSTASSKGRRCRRTGIRSIFTNWPTAASAFGASDADRGQRKRPPFADGPRFVGASDDQFLIGFIGTKR